MEIVKHVFGRENDELDENIIFSPLSINTLLGMVASRLNHGPTLERLLGLLGFKTLDDLHQKALELEQTALLSSPKNPDCLVLSSFNATWVDKKYTLNPNFEQVLKTVYKAETFTVDFENKVILLIINNSAIASTYVIFSYLEHILCTCNERLVILFDFTLFFSFLVCLLFNRASMHD